MQEVEELRSQKRVVEVGPRSRAEHKAAHKVGHKVEHKVVHIQVVVVQTSI